MKFFYFFLLDFQLLLVEILEFVPKKENGKRDAAILEMFRKTLFH